MAAAEILLPQWGAWHADRLLSFTFILTVLFAFASWRLFEKPVARAGFIALIRPISGDEAEHCGRLISTVVVLACSWSFCGYAVATAPEQTSVAQSLGISSRLLQQRNHAALERRRTPMPRKPRHKMPDGSQMAAIGDSVMLASSKGLQDTFPNIIVDAEVSRSMAKGQGLVDQLKAQGNLRPWVLVGLATNSVVTNDQLDDLLNDVGPDHVLVLINAHAPVSWVPGTNAVLKQFAAAHSNNVVLVDWDGTISQHADELAGDGIHPGMSNTIYAQAVKDSIAA